MDCLKRFRRKKPLLVEKLAVACMQIALGDKTSVLETTLWLNLCKGKQAGVWGGALPLTRNFFRFWAWKWRLLVHSGCLSTRRGGAWPLPAPFESASVYNEPRNWRWRYIHSQRFAETFSSAAVESITSAMFETVLLRQSAPLLYILSF